eukprot:TRINITY_DN24380_c0_g1_i2.p4 TRINITY_DN24380_c0_g1~~TRINITY_DN24380_c0_g1_i2.p4  ORF type:complete len:123 (+),score=57.98 TRINITY_DN24380_c0_g1_i2:42-371(+)
MGNDCLFAHSRDLEALDAEDFDVAVVNKEREENVAEEEEVQHDSDLEGLQIDPSLWRYTENPADFRSDDKVKIVKEQESAEEYTPKQRERLGSEGAVVEVANGGYVCTL